jgi:2-hydroxychromene-2-carboxylate isomerase
MWSTGGEVGTKRYSFATNTLEQGMNTHPAAARPLEFWFDFASNYSYLSAMRIEALSAQRAVPLVWRPFLLGPIFQDKGWSTSPFVLDKVRGEYAWTDTARQARKFGLPWHRPTVFPRDSLLAARVALLLADTASIGPFVRACMHRNFVLDLDIAASGDMAPLLERLGLDAPAVLRAATEPGHKLRLRRQVDLARAAGIFGAPSFLVDGELFWGNDRLDDALSAATCGG